MQLGNQVEWALHCASTLASLESGKRLSASALAELFEVPPKYLAKALQSLSAAGLIGSTAGPKGGYCLTRSADSIRLVEIVDAIEGSGKMFRCQEIRRRGPCRSASGRHFSKPCQLAEVMWRAESAWRRELESVTLGDILHRVGKEVAPALLKVLNGWVEQNATN